MTSIENSAASTISDVKKTFAWGQLFAGSIIGGLAVWKLAHKLTNTEPSEWFAGLSAAYEEVRDFVLTPLSWLQLDLTMNDKNTIVVVLVLLGIAVRTAIRFPSFLLFIVIAMGVVARASLDSDFTRIVGGIETHKWLHVTAFALVLTIVVFPLRSLLEDDPDLRRMSLFALLSTFSTVACGVALLLMNWAT